VPSPPADKALRALQREFTAYCASLPKLRFQRTKARLSAEIYCPELGDTIPILQTGTSVSTGFAAYAERFLQAISLSSKKSASANRARFVRGLDYLLELLPLLKGRVRTSDDFDLPAFIEHCTKRRHDVPKSAKAFAALLESIEATSIAALQKLDPWECLDEDWSRYHPNARQRLNDVFFWDCVDELAPHGNDTGADLLEEYADWHKRNGQRNGKGDALAFLKRLFRKWGLSLTDEEDAEAQGEAWIALAFAELKFNDACTPEVRRQALLAIEPCLKHLQTLPPSNHENDIANQLKLKAALKAAQ
jgi:hypothetical protein